MGLKIGGRYCEIAGYYWFLQNIYHICGNSIVILFSLSIHFM